MGGDAMKLLEACQNEADNPKPNGTRTEPDPQNQSHRQSNILDSIDQIHGAESFLTS
jgi:hypothetical protein